MLTGVVEGSTDEAALARIAEMLEIPLSFVHVKHGRKKIERRIAGYRSAAKLAPWIVLIDQDDDPCAVATANKLCDDSALHVRVVVHEIEAWLMGDAASLARFLRVAIVDIPTDPEAIINPKERLLQIATSSRSRAIRNGMIPSPKSARKRGPRYSDILSEFALFHWDPLKAAERCRSLAGCIRRLEQARDGET